MLVLMTIKLARGAAIRFRRNDRARRAALYGRDQRVGIIGFVGDHGFDRQPFEQKLCLREIMCMASAQRLSGELTQPFDQAVNHGAQSAPRAAQRELPTAPLRQTDDCLWR